MESEKCHLGGIIIRDLSSVVSNYRSTQTLDEYLKAQNVLGASACPCPLLSSCFTVGTPGRRMHAWRFSKNSEARACACHGSGAPPTRQCRVRVRAQRPWPGRAESFLHGCIHRAPRGECAAL